MTLKDSLAQQSANRPLGDDLTYKLDYEYLQGTHKAVRIGSMYYAYDGNGNMTAERLGSSPQVDARTGNLTEEAEGVYAVDYGFALTYDTGNSGGNQNVYQRNYEWNERNLLKRSIDRQYVVDYRYGVDGQRAIKYSVSGVHRNETLYFNKMYQISPVGSQQIESKHIYVGETRILTKQREVGNVNLGEEQRRQFYYHGDHLGSAQLVTNYQGNIYEHLEYTPYGELWIDRASGSVGDNPTVFRFTAQERDRETGLYYFGARYLDPKTSRWLSTDPAMHQGDYIPGAPINDEARERNGNLPGMGGVFNYINFHVYHYAGNNPIKYVDPDGESATVTGFIIGGITGGVSALIQGKEIGSKEFWAGVTGGAVSGAIAGAAVDITIATGGTAGLIIAGGFIAGGAGSITESLISGDRLKATNILADAAIGGISSAIGYGVSRTLANRFKREMTNMLMSDASSEIWNKIMITGGEKGVELLAKGSTLIKQTLAREGINAALNLVSDILQDKCNPGIDD